MSEGVKRNLSVLAVVTSIVLLLFLCRIFPRLTFAEHDGGEHLRIVSAEYVPEGIKLLIGHPYGFTNQLDVFTSIDPYKFIWILEDTLSVDPATNRVEWCDVLHDERKKTFYRIGNAGFDSDSDGLADAQEKYIYGTSTNNPNTDEDEAEDGFEVLMGTDPLDGTSYPTDPADDVDSDGDGMPDWWENLYFEGITNALPGRDEEPDGWSNLQEYLRGGNPTNSWIPDDNNLLELKVKTPLRN